ncbi:hypothetical protein PR048_004321 [Dryococelus australis]|uniref:Uncharacterized protein n=1 Tax=Dryococelus australis TaxID=614101 RepID=A0ABQ9I537_9NEOP|nr:hypothetical protein PR048_004321 [Dryococelus australis]
MGSPEYSPEHLWLPRDPFSTTQISNAQYLGLNSHRSKPARSSTPHPVINKVPSLRRVVCMIPDFVPARKPTGPTLYTGQAPTRKVSTLSQCPPCVTSITLVEVNERNQNQHIMATVNIAARALASQGEPGSIPGGVAHRFLYVGIMSDSAASLWVFSRIYSFPCPCIPALLYIHLIGSPDQSIKTQITSLCSSPGNDPLHLVGVPQLCINAAIQVYVPGLLRLIQLQFQQLYLPLQLPTPHSEVTVEGCGELLESAVTATLTTARKVTSEGGGFENTFCVRGEQVRQRRAKNLQLLDRREHCGFVRGALIPWEKRLPFGGVGVDGVGDKSIPPTLSTTPPFSSEEELQDGRRCACLIARWPFTGDDVVVTSMSQKLSTVDSCNFGKKALRGKVDALWTTGDLVTPLLPMWTELLMLPLLEMVLCIELLIADEGALTYPIQGSYNCCTENYIYQLQCIQCSAEYADLTTHNLRQKMNGHRADTKQAIAGFAIIAQQTAVSHYSLPEEARPASKTSQLHTHIGKRCGSHRETREVYGQWVLKLWRLPLSLMQLNHNEMSQDFPSRVIVITAAESWYRHTQSESKEDSMKQIHTHGITKRKNYVTPISWQDRAKHLQSAGFYVIAVPPKRAYAWGLREGQPHSIQDPAQAIHSFPVPHLAQALLQQCSEDAQLLAQVDVARHLRSSHQQIPQQTTHGSASAIDVLTPGKGKLAGIFSSALPKLASCLSALLRSKQPWQLTPPPHVLEFSDCSTSSRQPQSSSAPTAPSSRPSRGSAPTKIEVINPPCRLSLSYILSSILYSFGLPGITAKAGSGLLEMYFFRRSHVEKEPAPKDSVVATIRQGQEVLLGIACPWFRGNQAVSQTKAYASSQRSTWGTFGSTGTSGSHYPTPQLNCTSNSKGNIVTPSFHTALNTAQPVINFVPGRQAAWPTFEMSMEQCQNEMVEKTGDL